MVLRRAGATARTEVAPGLGLGTVTVVGGSDVPDDVMRARAAELDERERRLAERERAADLRDARADARERRADRREMQADSREAAANERERHLDGEATGDRPDPIDRFQESVGRTSARTDRSNEFLERSREAVQRGVDRIDRLRRGSDGSPQREPADDGESGRSRRG